MTSEELQERMTLNLMERLEGSGSTLFSMTWKAHLTPAQRLIFRLRASALPTSGNGCGSWPSPVSEPSNGSPETYLERKGRQPDGAITDIGAAAQLAGWHTASAGDAHGTYYERYTENGIAPGQTCVLRDQAQLASWPTPLKADGRGRAGAETHKNSELPNAACLVLHGPIAPGSPAGTERRGQLNPALPRWLMGFPPEWDDCAVTATPSSRKSRRK